MRSIVGWLVPIGLFVAAAACGKKEQAVPAPAPAVEAVGAVVPVERSPVVDAGGPPVAADAAPVEPSPPAVDAAAPPEPLVEARPAPDAAPPEPSPSDFVTETGSAEGLGVESIELCSAVESRVCMGAKREFAPGEMVWALLRLTNSTRAETEVRVSYLPAGASPEAGRGLALRVAEQERYTTFSKASKQQDGTYDVIVATVDGTEIARARFQVGSGIAAAPDVPVPVEPPVPPVAGNEPVPLAAGAGLGVASIELCRAIESRRCAEPATAFAPREMVWALLRVTNPDRVETQLLVSYLAADGAPVPGEGLALSVPAQERYTTYSKAGKSNPGQYEVVVCAPDGRELARAAFEVR
jgi:hypothetical protein